ncbi:hypothetical protein TRIP_C90040 [Candidatus Zixiibacteriota bacterium]|nr:hypothetical protein TRIP_C90040 [candidate division Zixibacteria bacterium]
MEIEGNKSYLILDNSGTYSYNFHMKMMKYCQIRINSVLIVNYYVNNFTLYGGTSYA